MRWSLKTVGTRVERISRRTRSHAAEDVARRVRSMSNGELAAGLAHLAETVAGAPAESFKTADAFLAAITAVLAEAPAPDQDQSRFLNTARQHWDRVHWLQAHDSHGRLTFASEGRGSWEPDCVATCSCAETLRMFDEQVPAQHRR